MRVFCDMDGVLADFGTPAGEFLGLDFSKGFIGVNEQQWDSLRRAWPMFWLDLELMPNALKLWTALNPWHPSLLTAVPNVWPTASVGKTRWAKTRLPGFGQHPSQQIFCVLRHEKQQFAKTNGKPNVLIDDLGRNIQEWERAGGIGFVYEPTTACIAKIEKSLSVMG